MLSRLLIRTLSGTAILFASTWAFASLKAPDFSIKTSTTANKVVLEATPPTQHHFNLDAPMSAELESSRSRIKPKKSSEKAVVFEIPSAAKDSAKVALFLCDDAKTFCEKHQVSVSWEGIAGAATTPKASSSAPKSASRTRPAIDHHGFYDNRPEDAFEQAKKSDKPLMIDFYGIWCPPCNELNDQVFSKREFKKDAASFIKLKMDADAPETEALSQRYGIQGFPTVIFASPEGDEIGRVVGFRPLTEFLASMKTASENRSKTFSTLKVKADAGDQAAADQIGVIYLNRGDYELAEKYLKKTKIEREKLREAQIGIYHARVQGGDDSATGKWISSLEAAIQEFPASPDSVFWRDDLASALDDQKKSEEAKRVRRELIVTAKRLLNQPERLKGYDMSNADLYVSIGEAATALGDKSEADSAFSSGAALYRKKIKEGGTRGGTLELAYCLRRLGETDEAERLYAKMQKAYPKEFTFWLADARMNMQLKKYDRARKLAQKAYENSYGANKLDSALVLAKAWKELGQPEEGKKVISSALESLPPMPPTTNRAARSRIRSRVETLNKLSADLSQAKS